MKKINLQKIKLLKEKIIENREEILRVVKKICYGLAAAIAFVLVCWGLAKWTNRMAEEKERELAEKRIAEKLKEYEDKPFESRCRMKIDTKPALNERNNLVFMKTAIITIDTTQALEIWEIPNDVSNVIIEGCNEEYGVYIPKNVTNILLKNCKSLKKIHYPNRLTNQVRVENCDIERARIPFTRNFQVKDCDNLREIYTLETLEYKYKFNIKAINCPKLSIVYSDIKADSLVMDNCPNFSIEKSLGFYKDERYSEKHLCKNLVYQNYRNEVFSLGEARIENLTIRNFPNLIEAYFSERDNYDEIKIEKCPNLLKYNVPPDCKFTANVWSSPNKSYRSAIIFGDYMYSVNSEGYGDEYIEEGNITLLAYGGDSKNFVIPQSIEGIPVKYIDFVDSMYHFKSVTTPEDFNLEYQQWLSEVEVINFGKNSTISRKRNEDDYYNYVLYNEDYLESDTLFNNLIEIKNYYCEGDNKVFEDYYDKYHINDTIKFKIPSLFKNSPRLRKVSLSKEAIRLSDFEFWNCNKLKDIKITDNVTNIGKYALMNTGITEITIPKNTSIDEMAIGFKNATLYIDERETTERIVNAYTGYTFDGQVIKEYLASITTQKVENFQINGYCSSDAQRYAYNWGFVFNAIDNNFSYEKIGDNDCRITKYNGDEAWVVIPDKIQGLKVKEVAPNAFEGKHSNVYHKKQGLPANTTFDSKSGLYTYIPQEQTGQSQYLDYTFADGVITRYSGESENITIPESIQGHTIYTIGRGAFFDNEGGMSKYKVITIPESITRIEDDAFYLYSPKDCNDLSFRVKKGSYGEKFAQSHRREYTYY